MYSENNKYSRKLIIVALLSVFFAQTILSQTTTSISGIVKDQNEAAIAGATVIATNTGSDGQITTTTDQNGKYEFKSLSPGRYRIKIAKSGFSGAGANVSVTDGENSVQDFTVGLGSLREEVTVTAAKGLRATVEIPQSVTVVTESEIQDRRPIGVSDAYEKSPSVLTTDPNPYRSRPQIRGLQSSRILITVDGERLNNARFSADFVGVSPSLVDTSQIQTVEVVAGSSSSLYGSDAVGGTVNIITKGASREKDGRRVDMKFDGDFGSNNKYHKGAFALGYGEKHVAFRANIARFQFPNYHLGGEGVTREEVLKFGNFARQAGNAIGQNVIGSYAVYDFEGNGEVLNSQARGYLGGGDLQFYPNDKQTVRIRYQVNRYRDLGVGFSGSPTGVNKANTGFSNVDKFSGRYELREITNWLPRIQFSGFFQEYKRSLNEERKSIVPGSSCVAVTPAPPQPPTPSCPASTTFTGNASVFRLATVAKTVSQNVTKGWDVQTNFIPFKNSLLITGVNYSNEESKDDFAQDTFSATTGLVTSSLSNVRNVPNTTYKNIGWYNQFEVTPIKYFRLTAGLRYDDWKTEARPTLGFPVGNTASIIAAIIPRVQASPGSFSAAGAAGTLALAQGASSLKTHSKVWTYNFGLTAFIPGGINPYVRYSTSFREPGLTDRFLVRNFFSSPNVISFVGLTNTELKSERGKDLDIGVKFARNRVRGDFAYFKSTINDALGTAQGSYCLLSNPAVGLLGGGCVFAPGPPPTIGHLALVFQTINFAKVDRHGWEAEIETDIPVGDVGSITPYFSIGYLKATNRNPDASRVTILNQFYNSSAPLELEGSANDAPFYSLPKYKYSFAPKFTSANGKWWAEYELRGTSKVTRVDPGEISFAQATQYYYFGAYKGFQKHSIRGGFKLGKELPMTVTLGVDNLLNKTYYSLFQPAPAMGRTFTIGTTISWSKFFK